MSRIGPDFNLFVLLFLVTPCFVVVVQPWDVSQFKKKKKLEQGHTIRIFNHDEMPQFLNYGVDETPSGLAYVSHGKSCKEIFDVSQLWLNLKKPTSFALCI